ncbi:MAG: ergothioneine biosynthesis protein EgtB [Pyrinomonas sp.]
MGRTPKMNDEMIGRPRALPADKGLIAEQLERTRERTLGLFDLAQEKHLHQSPGFGYRPIIWHLAHIGAFEEHWILQRAKGDAPLDRGYMRLFDPIKTPREESRDLPSRREMEDYLGRVRERTLSFLERASFTTETPLLRDAYVFHLVLEHERQHQETLLYLFQLLPLEKKNALPPVDERRDAEDSAVLTAESVSSDAREHWIRVPEGECVIGAVWSVFAYDNEFPSHTVHLPAFEIARTPVTNAEYLCFVEEGGYQRREFWSAQGWAWREREGWTAPLYWQRDEDGWTLRTIFQQRPLPLAHPVWGISWYEAEAYARFIGKRLPTEAEWERAASWDGARKRLYAWGDEPPSAKRCNFGAERWNTTPVNAFIHGRSACGCLDMTGNVWEWTASVFGPYDGFRPFPYPEYSAEWFDGDHRVLKGGSWATSASVLRTSFRNFFRRHFRIAFAGVRCAAEAN